MNRIKSDNNQIYIEEIVFGRGHSRMTKAPIVSPSLPLPHGKGKRIYFNMMTLNYIRWLLLQFYVLLFQFMDILVLFCKHCVKYSNFSRSKMIFSPILVVLAHRIYDSVSSPNWIPFDLITFWRCTRHLISPMNNSAFSGVDSHFVSFWLIGRSECWTLNWVLIWNESWYCQNKCFSWNSLFVGTIFTILVDFVFHWNQFSVGMSPFMRFILPELSLNRDSSEMFWLAKNS